MDHDAAPAPRLSFDALLRGVVLTAGLCIIVASLRAASVVLAPLMIAVFITAIGAAPVLWLIARRVPYWVAVALVGVAIAGSIVGLVFASLHWQREFAEKIPSYQAQAVLAVEALQAWLLDIGIADAVDGAFEGMRDDWFVPASARTLQLLSGTVFVLVLIGFSLAELAGLPVKLRAAYGSGNDRVVGLHRAGTRLMAYFRIKAVTSAFTGLFAGIACWLVGVDSPVLWGLVAFLFNFAPTIGSLVAAVPPVLLAWLMLGWQQAAIVGGAYLVINVGIGAIIEPKLLGDRMDFSPMAVLVSLLFWAWVWGVAGVLLAVPITMVLKNILESTTGLRPVGILLGSARAARSAIPPP